MSLTGRPGAPPPGPPARLVGGIDAVAASIRRRSAQLGTPVKVEPLQLLGERAAIAGHRRRGEVSCGGATRLLRTADGWMAVSLARPEDVDLVPAWLCVDPPTADQLWPSIARAARSTPAGQLVERAALLGLPASRLAERRPPTEASLLARNLPVRTARVRPGRPYDGRVGDLLVVDLSSLWAGPLCGSLLAAAGMDVVKVESTSRPDGARRGPAEFFDLLHGGKRSVALDLATPEGARMLRRLLERADVVIEGSRPRALEHLGIRREELLARASPRVWISITGHGRSGEHRDRVAFGDDAAVAGGLVCWDDRGPSSVPTRSPIP